ncbi:hypothetical protein VTI74DRAFT_9176 [Chaetomium olivicolor]
MMKMPTPVRGTHSQSTLASAIGTDDKTLAMATARADRSPNIAFSETGDLGPECFIEFPTPEAAQKAGVAAGLVQAGQVDQEACLGHRELDDIPAESGAGSSNSTGYLAVVCWGGYWAGMARGT